MRRPILFSEIEQAIIHEALTEWIGRKRRALQEGRQEELANTELENRVAIAAGGRLSTGEPIEGAGLLGRIGEPTPALVGLDRRGWQHAPAASS